jgi:hypothetical protein
MVDIIKRVITAVIIFLPMVFGGGDMARYTRPVPGRSDTYPNAGPYTGDQWAERINIVNVGDDGTTAGFRYSRGPFASYLNRLAVTNPAGADFTIATGAGLCNGHLMINDAAVTITADTPAANPRIDRVVMVYNNTNAPIAATTVGPFTFNVAGGGTDIPAYTCELAIMKGAENVAPALPALEQNAVRLWMVELFRYQISVVPAITNFTDYRDYVDAETKRIFLSAPAVNELATDTHRYNNVLAGAIMTDGVLSKFDIAFTPPKDLIGTMTGYFIVDSNAAGNAYLRYVWTAAADGEAIGTHSSVGPYTAVALLNGYIHTRVKDMTFTGTSWGDIIIAKLERDASDPLDTVGANIYVQGLMLEYLGYRR